MPGLALSFRGCTIRCGTCAADEMVISDPAVFSGIASALPDEAGALNLGGQAALAGVQMQRLGMTPVTCVVPGSGPRTRMMLKESGVLPLTFPESHYRPDILHLIFEHAPGLVPLAPRVVPRSNWFIVSPEHDPSTVLFPRKRRPRSWNRSDPVSVRFFPATSS